ncbi:HORMA domain-containing protein 2-like [Protopterus annectens]|uniref:HORMA domain-containing protein 2-like n=1 Tax=Protopterus annectens TaxID=7888 RepID=UPI001CFACECE|nr:HORMA domain-containing protein 2-like [Protopterus annectens]
MDFVSSHIDIKTRVSNEEIKKTSVLLLRKLYILMQNLGPLPNDVTLTMKLFYYNDVTPDDYHPSGFKKDKSMSSLTFEGDPVHLKVGALTTGFHSMKVKVTTESDRVTAMGEELVQEKSTEISHRGLDCDEEEEEECVNLCTLVSRNDPERKTEVAERTEYDADAFWTNEEERNTVNPTKVNSANLIETKKTKSIIHREEENQQPEEGPTLLEALKTSRNDDNNDQSTLDFSCSQDGRIAQKRRKVSVPVRNYEPYN